MQGTTRSLRLIRWDFRAFLRPFEGLPGGALPGLPGGTISWGPAWGNEAALASNVRELSRCRRIRDSQECNKCCKSVFNGARHLTGLLLDWARAQPSQPRTSHSMPPSFRRYRGFWRQARMQCGDAAVELACRHLCGDPGTHQCLNQSQRTSRNSWPTAKTQTTSRRVRDSENPFSYRGTPPSLHNTL